MPTIQINKRVNPGRLSDALVAAGIPVVTIRTIGLTSGEIVLPDGADVSAAAAVLAAHAHDSDAERDALQTALATLEDDNATNAQHLRALRTVAARLARRAIAEREAQRP